MKLQKPEIVQLEQQNSIHKLLFSYGRMGLATCKNIITLNNEQKNICWTQLHIIECRVTQPNHKPSYSIKLFLVD